MSTPDPEGMTLAAKVIAALVAVGTPITWLYSQLSKKADKEELAKCLKHIEKLYENAEDDRKLTRDLHDKAMESVAAGQQQIISILTRERR